MKIKTLPLVGALLSCTALHAHENHSATKKEAGPNGGRIITTIEPRAEFFVTPERKVQITFLGEDGKPVASADQVITVTTGERSAPVRLAFTKTDTVFLSEQTVPDGNNFPLVLQIKPTPDAKATVTKFTLNLSACPECKLAEYACICSHEH